MDPKRSDVERAVVVLRRNLEPEKWQKPDGWADALPQETRDDILTAVRATEVLQGQLARTRVELNATRAALRKSVSRATQARERIPLLHRAPARALVERVLSEHILYGYGQCSCGVTFPAHGRYSRDHRRHLAVEIVAASEADS